MSAYADQLPRKRCPCGRLFVPPYEWATWCRVCYHERAKDYDMALAELAFEKGYLLGLARTPEPPGLGALIADLLALCHPDRHPPERFALANRTTARLLEMRGE